MAGVTPEDVRNRINLSSSDIDGPTVTEFIVDACAEVEIETGRTISYSSCPQAGAACIQHVRRGAHLKTPARMLDANPYPV